MHSSTQQQLTDTKVIRASRRRMLEQLPRVALVLDVAVMVLVGAVAVLLRVKLGWFSDPMQLSSSVVDNFWTAGPIVLVGWIAAIAALGGYREQLFGAGVNEYRLLLNATVIAAGLTGIGCYLFKVDLSRGFYVMVFTLGSVALVAQRAVLRSALRRARRAGRLGHDVVIAGTPANVDEVAHILSRESWLGYRVLGAILPPGFDAIETVRGTPVLGTTDNTLQLLNAANADVIFVAGGALDGADQMRELVWELEHHDIRVVVAPSVTDISRERIRIVPEAGLPLVHIDPPRYMLATRRAKRIFDAVVCSAILLAVAPVFVFIALRIKTYDRGPIFFKQVRVGRNGEEFLCFKFRTMVIDAESKVAEMQAAQGFTGVLWKMKDDPRITRPGKWLRRLSLDELPQLLNVFRGDMSLVGPRPQVPDEVACYDQSARRRLHVRPGMTGLWQVSGRSELSWAEAIRLDLYYVDNWSMVQDLTILARTFGAVVKSRGAY